MADSGRTRNTWVQPLPKLSGRDPEAGDAPPERFHARGCQESGDCLLVTPIVLVPGLLCSSEIFAAQIPALWAFGPVTVASTLEGERIDEAAASILRNAPPHFALAGISMGGYLALEIMRQAPSRVLKLALLDTSARPDTSAQTDARLRALAQARIEFMGIALPTLTSLLHPHRRGDLDILNINSRMARAVGLEGYERQARIAISRPDSRPFLGAIEVPTLVLVGDCDPLTPLDHSQEIASAVPRAELKVVPDCGHLSPIEQPGRVSEALADWIGA
jgi:pimeloyl-ACP methyl ester carboxylesterase